MTQVNMLEAKTKLSKLVEAIETGSEQEIVLARNGKPVARIVPLNVPVVDTSKRLGIAEGKFGDLDETWFREWQALDEVVWQGFYENPSKFDVPKPKARTRKKRGMRLLLDTHVLIWSIADPRRIPLSVKRMIESGENQVFVSVVSLLEIATKRAAGRRSRPDIAAEEVLAISRAASYQLLPIEPRHAIAVETIASYHGDPLDRLLLAQAQIEGMRLVTHDELIASYDSRTILF